MSAVSDDSRLIVQSADPFNAEPRAGDLVSHYLTPAPLFYVRSHGEVPALAADHRVVIGGPGLAPRAWTRGELEARFAEREVVATLQCAGNRRADLQSVARTNGDPWGVGAIGTARWTGVALVDVLREAGLADDATGFACFTAADEGEVEGERAPYGVSIALDKARERDVLIAWAMNGEPLPPEHGAPLRLVVPGFAGVRSIKWLTRIDVSDAPSAAPIQARDYKLFPPEVTSLAGVDWDAGLTIEALPVNAAICAPADGARVAAGATAIEGYAIAYGRALARVEVSADGGRSWVQAAWQDAERPGAWRRWRLETVLAPGEHELVVRAVDAAGQGQPERPEQVWNVAGYLATHWHRITVTAG